MSCTRSRRTLTTFIVGGVRRPWGPPPLKPEEVLSLTHDRHRRFLSNRRRDGGGLPRPPSPLVEAASLPPVPRVPGVGGGQVGRPRRPARRALLARVQVPQERRPPRPNDILRSQGPRPTGLDRGMTPIGLKDMSMEEWGTFCS